ncbi:MAG: Ig-like domain-containing protein, partial [Planctomycetota bacterium]
MAHNPSGQRTAALALTVLAAALPSCGTDNPACIFGPGTCFGGGVGIGANPAFLPEAGQIVRDGAPQLNTFVPNGGAVAPTSPIVITFTETIAASTVSAASFQVTDTLTGLPVQVVSQLVADGLVLVLLPSSTDPNTPALTPGQSYQVVYNDAGMPLTDITGQELELSNNTLGTFNVLGTAPAAPGVL